MNVNANEEPEQQCPNCNTSVWPNPRYPHHLCRVCANRLSDAHGRPIALRTISQSMTGAWGEYEDGSHTDLEATTRGVIVFCDGVRCQAREAYFGGTVIEPAALVRPLS